MADFQLLMLSAMNENGGNTTHRLLDGHPELFVYPYESQVGTRFIQDHLGGMYPAKYRWPLFPVGVSPRDSYEMIIDEETKIRLRTPHVSKFRDAHLEMQECERIEFFLRELEGRELSRPHLIAAFFKATFQAWRNFSASGQERTYVGYNPIIGVDAQAIIEDYQGAASVLHVVRNPFSAYADRKKRPTQQSVAHYALAWQICIQEMKAAQRRHPQHAFLLRYEDIIAQPVQVLGGVLARIGHATSERLAEPSWNGQRLPQIYPWGTIRIPTSEANLATARELSRREVEELQQRLAPLLEEFGYSELASTLLS